MINLPLLENKPINVLTLFNGIEGISLALERSEIKVNQIFASEIDPYANKIAKKNFPNTIHLGDIKNWKSWDLPKIDLLVGGFPCQSYSFAGKGLNFEDPRGQLFFDLIAIKNYYNPKYFLFENTPMDKYILKEISHKIGVDPVKLNSRFLSAQDRPRMYWFNWNHKPMEDKRILLRSIIEPYNAGKPLSEKELAYMNRQVKGGRTHWDFKHHCDINKDKSVALVANLHKGVPYNVIIHEIACARVVGRYLENGIRRDGKGKPQQYVECRIDGKTGTLTTVTKDNVITEFTKNRILAKEKYYRKLTPIECERLQTYPDFFTEGISSSRRYKCLGNSFTVDVIAHILKSMFLSVTDSKKPNLGMRSIFGKNHENI